MMNDNANDDDGARTAPTQVLPYRSPDAGRRRAPTWLLLLIGFGCGVGFMLLGSWVMWARSVATANVSATVVQAQSTSISNPLTPGISLTAEQDAGRIVTSRNSIGVPYGKFVMLCDGKRLVALRITCPSGLGRAIDYEWREVAPAEHQGSGSAVEKGGSAPLHVGPFELVWSRGGRNGGWVYWPSNRGFAVATTVAEGPDDFEAVLKSTKWRDSEGETPDPREVAQKQQKVTSK